MALDFEKIRKVRNQLGLDKDARLSNPSESTRINNIYTKEKALKPTQKVDPDRTGIEEFVPVIGDALDFTKIGEDINDKNYGQAALGLGLLLIPNAIEKPIKAGVKALKRPIKKYGTKIANKLENVFPNMVDKFHTWNISDNIKNATKEEVINAKKSRLLERPANNLDVHNKFRFGNSNYNLEGKEYMANSYAPQGKDRINRIENVKVDDAPLTFNPEKSFSDVLYNLYMTREDIPYEDLLKDMTTSHATRKYIHVGDRIFDKEGNYKLLNNFNQGTLFNHELDHYVSIPGYSDRKKLGEVFPLLDYKDSYNNVLNRTEIKARLGQMLDYYLVKGKDKISKSQLKSAIKVRNHPNVFNSLSNPLKGEVKQLKNIDLNKLLETINTMSLKHGGKINI